VTAAEETVAGRDHGAGVAGARSRPADGTIGGSLAHADPAAELPAVARALNAEFVVRGPSGERVIPAAQWFEGYLTTSRRPDELLVEVRFPAADREVTTIEGLAQDGELGTLQQAMWDSHSFQCGFCTPGFVMQATAFLGAHPDADEQEIREALSGNICRCTGYQSIIDGILLAAQRNRTLGNRELS